MRLSALLPIVFVPAMVAAQMRVDQARSGLGTHEEILYLWSGRHVRHFAPGFETVAADFYWLRTVQYFGSQRAYAEQKDYALLQPLIDITVDLDPKLEIAYRYGAIFLAEPWPNGKGDAKAGVGLLERGALANPESWRLRQDLGYYTFLFLGDARTAARILSDASTLPGAPFWLKTLAASVLSKGGDRAMSRQMWAQMYEQATEDFVKKNALYNLRRIDALDAQDAWNARLKQYREKVGRWPSSLVEFARSGLPLYDPAGVLFSYNPETGAVSIAKESPLWRNTT